MLHHLPGDPADNPAEQHTSATDDALDAGALGLADHRPDVGGRVMRVTDLHRLDDLDHPAQLVFSLMPALPGRVRDNDPESWLPVECEGLREGYQDMETFIDTLADPHQTDLLQIAIQGRGAFRRFKDALERTPDELDRWFAFSEERQRGRARTWLAEAGYKPLAAPPLPFIP